MWDRRTMEKMDEAVGQFSVSCKFKNVEDQFGWAFTGIYGPNVDQHRAALWEELSRVRVRWTMA